MIKPDDDFDDDFQEDDSLNDESVSLDASSDKPDQKQCDARRKIEDILEKRRLAAEIGELDLD